jgi:hypothetical protein
LLLQLRQTSVQLLLLEASPSSFDFTDLAVRVEFQLDFRLVFGFGHDWGSRTQLLPC